jgi:carbon monoxide dehydrogenase subunit G
VAIEIKETFEVAAPIERVWQFVLDPQNVAACMPGASLDQVVDERTFLGNIKVKVGAVMASYKGRVELVEVDEASHTVKMKAEGTESGGGTARGSMMSKLVTLPDGRTEVVAEASVDLTGRIMQVGRGMIQGVSKQLFQQFVKSARAQLEAEAAAVAAGAPPPPPPVKKDEAINAVSLLFTTLWQAIVDVFRRLFGRSKTMPGGRS